MVFRGRKEIYTDATEITRENVLSVLRDSLPVHQANKCEIDYLYRYYKGEQPIIHKVKTVREEINNVVLENRANEIVSFKTGYLMGEPVQYIARGEDASIIEKIKILNDYMYSEDRSFVDMDVATWFHICGVGYKMAVPDPLGEEDDAPFEIYSLDPRNTFVVKTTKLGNKVVMAVNYTVNKDNQIDRFFIYTPTRYFVTTTDAVLQEEKHTYGGIPIVEYPANKGRIGAFELVITILDAINQVQSDRIDAVDQFVQALLVFKGVDISSKQFKDLRQSGGLLIPLDGDVNYLTQELNQMQTQSLVDNMYNTVLQIVGMPSQGDGSTSDSSNNGAMIVKNGWQQAEARAKEAERCFERSEKEFLKIVINICNDMRGTDFKIQNIAFRFTRKNYENIQMKSQVLTTMLASGKIAPQLAFEYCGMFIDSDLAYMMSKAYVEEQENKAMELMEKQQQNQEENPEEEENNEQVSNEV